MSLHRTLRRMLLLVATAAGASVLSTGSIAARIFFMDVHSNITDVALFKAGFSDAEREVVRFANVGQEFVRYLDHEHFDNEKIAEGWKFVNDQLDSSRLENLGKALHALQDFYAHSNYVELAIAYYTGPDRVPTFDIAIQDSAFRKIWEKEATTGYYPDGDAPAGKIGHKDLAKDIALGPRPQGFYVAKRLATVHSTRYAREWKKRHLDEVRTARKDD